MRRPALSSIVIATGLLACAAPAQATSLETWVSGGGTDSGACTRAAPCKTFQFAHNQTTAGGMINVLTAGNFGPVNITKSISIVADGVEALIRSTTVCPLDEKAAICISAATVVSLRGLTIDLDNVNANGIFFLSGNELHVHNSVIRRTGASGITFVPSSPHSSLFVVDTTVADSASVGVLVKPTGGNTHNATLERVRLEKNFIGVEFYGDSGPGAINGTVRESVISGSQHSAIFAQRSSASAILSVMIDRSAAVNNSDGLINPRGLYVNGIGAAAYIGDSTFSGNGTNLLAQNGGTIASFGTNKVDDSSIPTSAIAMK